MLSLAFILSVGLGGLMLFFIGLAVGRSRSSADMQTRLNRMTEEMRSHELEMKQIARTNEKMRAEKQAFNNFLLHMSEFARDINTELDRKKLGGLLLRMVDQLFSARTILVYFTASDGETLQPVACKGIPETDIARTPARLGVGRIGYAAEYKRTMTRDDFSTQTKLDDANFDNDPLGAKLDLVAPMVHADQTVGVICIGGAEMVSADQARKMLKMAADLGSAALHNAQAFHQIETSANHDGLTRLFNKRHFMEQFSQAMFARERKPGKMLSVFLFDIDHFKSYNDGNGHVAGDEVLKTTGRLLREFNAKNPNFIVGRYGGEEFVVAMPDTAREDAREAAEAIRVTIQQYEYPHEKKQPKGDLTISGGVAVFPEDGANTTELLSRADKALYLAKSNGRNRVEVFEAKFLGAEEEEVAWENR